MSNSCILRKDKQVCSAKSWRQKYAPDSLWIRRAHCEGQEKALGTVSHNSSLVWSRAMAPTRQRSDVERADAASRPNRTPLNGQENDGGGKFRGSGFGRANPLIAAYTSTCLVSPYDFRKRSGWKPGSYEVPGEQEAYLFVRSGDSRVSQRI